MHEITIEIPNNVAVSIRLNQASLRRHLDNILGSIPGMGTYDIKGSKYYSSEQLRFDVSFNYITWVVEEVFLLRIQECMERESLIITDHRPPHDYDPQMKLKR